MSEFQDFYPSWLGVAAFGANSTRLRDNEPFLFRPTDISGCVMWFDANNQDYIAYNEFLQVSSWSNQGTIGGQWDISGTEAVQYGVSTQNQLNTISFAENAFMTGNYALDFQPRSIFFVTRENTVPPGVPNPWISCDTNGGMETFSQRNGTTVYFLGKHPSPIPEIAIDTSNSYLGYASLTEFINGTDLSDNWFGINTIQYPPVFDAVASGYSTGTLTYYLGGYFAGSTIASAQDVCEIVMYDTALKEPDRQNVETYLMVKWGIKEPPPPPIPVFTPTDISGLYLWMDATQPSSFSLSVSTVNSWSNVGLSSNVFNADSNIASVVTDNGLPFVEFPTETTLTTTATFPYMTRTAFAVFQNHVPLDTLTYPYINLLNTTALGGRQLGANYDSNTTNYSLAMCQQAYNCPASGNIPGSLPNNSTVMAIWGVDSNTYTSSIMYFNGGSNINTSTDGPNLFDTGSGTYFIGSPVFDSPSFRIGEIIEYDSLLTTAQLSTVAGYLATKWAISSFSTIV